VSIEIRTVANEQELREATAAIVHYFGREKPDEEWSTRWLKNFELERMVAALDGDSIVGGAGALSMRMTVPGGAALGCAGVTVVGVLPTHRRRGILRSMMRQQLDDVHERGEPLAALWASEETIYGRYGYGLASLVTQLEIPVVHGAFHHGFERVGAVRLVEPDEAQQLMPQIYDVVRRRTPGMYERSAAWWEYRVLADPEDFRFGGSPKHLAVLEVNGTPQAYAIYRLHVTFGTLGPETTLSTIEVLGVSPSATASIWRYLLDVDWTRTVSARLQPHDSPLFLLLTRPNQAGPKVFDGLWIRLVDVGAALSGRTYAADGSVVLDVRDRFCPWNEGRWKLEDGRAARTDADGDLALDVADLASPYLGGFTFRDLANAHRVEELRDGAIARADAMFHTDAAPWCPEIF